MILQTLVQLAETERLIADPDFEFKPVAWRVNLGADGTIGPIEDNRRNLNQGLTDQKGQPVKPKLVGNDVLIPLFPTGRAGTKPRAAFLVDMAKFVFGRDPQSPADDGSLRPYVERFRHSIEDCEAATGDPHVAAVRKMLDGVLAGKAAVALPADVGSSDLFMFCVGADPTPVHARPSVHAYWKQRRAAVPAGVDPAQRTTCLVTGVPIVGKPALFPLIKGVPGAGTMGSALLAFNGPSSRTWSSYGLEGNENAPVSRPAAEAAATALNRLVDPRPTNGAGESLPVRRIRLSDDTIVVFWSPDPAPAVQRSLDRLPDAFDPPARAADDDRAIGTEPASAVPAEASGAKFYALTLTGTTGRIIVRDWLESTVGDVRANIRAYADDLRLLRPAGPGRTLELDDVGLPGLRDIKLTAYRVPADVPPAFGRDWLRLLWGGRAAKVPAGVVGRVTSRVQLTLAKGDTPATHAFAILKLHATREGDPDMRAYVNEDHPNPAYHCGRMLATLDFAQQRGLGETNTTNVRRMIGAIMTAPALYLGRLRRLTEVAYLPKMAGHWPDFLRDRIQSISGRLGDEMPRLLAMRDQSTFFLGFDQERTFLQTHPPSKYKWQTSIGLWVQSHGERHVVEYLAKAGLPFEYEPGLRVGLDRSRLPDFLVPAKADADRVFIEYQGMMDKPDYAARWAKKRDDYAALGLLPIESGGGPFGKLLVVDNLRHPDAVAIKTELHKHLGALSGQAQADAPEEPEGDDQ